MRANAGIRALIVGAGAVGQPYGRHLHLGGAEVSFLVKPKYVDELKEGMVFYHLNDRRKRTTPDRWKDYGLVTSAEEVGRSRWDQVYLTVASPALRGPWLPELVAKIGDATLVALQPGIDDRELLLQHLDASRLVQGLISLIAYAAPLPGETRFPEPGTAYWFPPLSPSPFSGPGDRLEAVLEALGAGDFPAKRHPDVGQLAGFPNAILTSYLTALEASGWTFDGLRKGGRLATAARAAREAIAIVGTKQGKPPPFLGLMARPSVIRAGLWLGQHAIPLDLETYLRVHFTKVGEQTRQTLSRYLELAGEAGLPAPAITELQGAIAALPGKAVASS